MKGRVIMNATHIVKASEIQRAWYLIDAEGLTLGRVASEVAKILKGKNNAIIRKDIPCPDNEALAASQELFS